MKKKFRTIIVNNQTFNYIVDYYNIRIFKNKKLIYTGETNGNITPKDISIIITEHDLD